MKRWLIAIVLPALAAIGAGQQRMKVDINGDTPEGQLLQQMGAEQDAGRKVLLGEQFLQKYPKHVAVLWVLGSLEPLYVKAGQFDKAIAAGERLLAADAGDAEAAFRALEAADGKQDVDLIIQWSNRTSEVARRVASKPKPAAEDEVETWRVMVDYAQQLDIRTEYSFYRALLENPDPQKKILLAEALEKRNPDSRYLPQMAEQWIMAYQQAGNRDRAAAVAKKIAGRDATNETVLATAADAALNKQDYARAVEYGEKLAALMASKAKPEGVPDADWEKTKNATAGLGYWYAGRGYAEQSQWPQADKALRAAIPLVKDNDQLLAAALFYAGLANHNLKKMADAGSFFEQCAKIKSPYQEQAQKNVKAIRGK